MLTLGAAVGGAMDCDVAEANMCATTYLVLFGSLVGASRRLIGCIIVDVRWYYQLTQLMWVSKVQACMASARMLCDAQRRRRGIVCICSYKCTYECT
jgi:hypothetical protein